MVIILIAGTKPAESENHKELTVDIFLQYNSAECLDDYLKMLGLYLGTLIIGHTFCSMLSMLN